MKPTTASVAPLARRWTSGDRAAGSDLVSGHDSWITAMARRRSLPWEDAEDTAQVMRMAFVDASERIDAGFADGETRRFLFLAMTRRLQDARSASRSPGVENCEDEVDVCVDGDAEAVAEVSMLMRAAGLSDDELDAVVARAVLEQDEAEYCREIGADHRQVGRLVESGLSKFRAAAEVHVLPVPRNRRDGQDELDARVTEFLSRNGPSTGGEIRAALGVGKFPLWRSTTRLRERGAVTMEGENRSAVYAVAAGAEAA